MTAQEMDTRILDLISQSGTTGGSNFTTARRLRALNEQHEILCTQKELGLVEQRVAIGISQGVNVNNVPTAWAYDMPTPSVDTNVAMPQGANPSAIAGFVAIKEMLNLQSAVIGQPVILKKTTYEEIVRLIYMYPMITFPIQFIWWANRKPRRGFVLYPIPLVASNASNSHLYVRFVAKPATLAGTESEDSILLPFQYHPMLCKYTAAALLKSIGEPAWEEERREAEVMLTEFVGHDNENVNQMRFHNVDKRGWSRDSEGFR